MPELTPAERLENSRRFAALLNAHYAEMIRERLRVRVERRDAARAAARAAYQAARREGRMDMATVTALRLVLREASRAVKSARCSVDRLLGL